MADMLDIHRVLAVAGGDGEAMTPLFAAPDTFDGMTFQGAPDVEDGGCVRNAARV